MNAYTETLDFILRKFGLKSRKNDLPIEIPDVGRNGLATLFAELGFTRGAEIGVQAGEYSEVLCRKIPGLRLNCVDPWKTYPGYRDWVKQKHLDGFLIDAHKRLDRYGVRFMQTTSMEAVREFKPGDLDFVYIDGNHDFQNVTNDIVEWSKIVRPGGIISGHDYMKRKRPTRLHVVYVLKGYTEAVGIRPWFVLGVLAKDRPGQRDFSRSWMWVNGGE